MRHLRLTTWNCRQGMTDRKLAALRSLHADVMVLQELQPDVVPPGGWQLELRRRDEPRVLGVLSRPGWRLRRLDDDPGLPWLLPVAVTSPDGDEITLLAVWTVKKTGLPGYVAQTQQVIAAWDRVRADGQARNWARTVLAGDLNASVQSDGAGPHLRTLAALADRGLTSAYHRASGAPHGGEPAQTLRWVGPGSVAAWFHCDFVFTSADLAAGLTAAVGAADEWTGPGMSDHCPVTADLHLTA